MTFSREIVSSWLQRINVHRSAPALFFCFDRVVIFICTSLSAEITAHVLGVWKSSLPRSGKEQEEAVWMDGVSRELSMGVEAVGLVVSLGAWWRSVRVSAHSQTLLDVLGLVAQDALPEDAGVVWWEFGAGSEVWAFSSAEEPVLDGFVTVLAVLQKILLLSRLVDVSLFILNYS